MHRSRAGLGGLSQGKPCRYKRSFAYSVEIAAVANPVVTEEEYLLLAEASDVKLEFVDGIVRPVGDPGPEMMEGGSLEHGALQFKLARLLGDIVDARGCRGFSSDTRVKVADSGQYVYPDL